MRELVDFRDDGTSLGYDNRVELTQYNDMFHNKEVEIIFDNFSLDTHPKGVRLSINIDNISILKLDFNYLRIFHGYTDKWENAVIKIFHQQEIIQTQSLGVKSVYYRKIPMSFFVLYDKKMIL